LPQIVRDHESELTNAPKNYFFHLWTPSKRLKKPLIFGINIYFLGKYKFYLDARKHRKDEIFRVIWPTPSPR
jgi:hypothetical protein